MQLLYLDPAQLEADPEGIREDAGDIAGLADTIREQGLLQPLGVVRTGRDRFRIVYGGRRCSAALHLGLQLVPCIVLDVGAPEVLLQQITENLQRQDLNDLEKANAFQRLRDQLSNTKPTMSEGELDEQVGRAVGIAARTVRRYLGLLMLPQEVQELLRGGELTVTQAQHLRRINNEKTLIQVAQLVVDDGLSAAEAAKLSNYFAANPNLNVDTALQALANGDTLRTTPTPVTSANGRAPTVAAKVDNDDDLWGDEENSDVQQEDHAFAAAETRETAATKARVFRLKSLEQMLDEAERMSRAYFEGDLQKWIKHDDGAAFKIRLLAKQLRALLNGLDGLVSDVESTLN
ncbi:MAG: ParB/RepB/Spo0J family partition protein [Herpetosiphon sp.]